MPKYRVTSPEGRTFDVTAPEGVSKDEVLSKVFNQQAQAPGVPKGETSKPPEGQTLNPRPFGLPAIPDPFDVSRRASEYLAKPLIGLERKAGELDVKAGKKTPAQAEQAAKAYGMLGTELAEGMAMPWTKAEKIPGAVGRILQSGLLGALQTGKPVSGGLSGLVGGAAGEGIAQIPKFWQMAKAARSQAADKLAFDKAMTESLNAADRAEYQKLVSAHEAGVEKSASSIVKDFKKLVPSWQELPDGVQGLQDMVVGQGQSLLSKKFDSAMKAVIDTGKGTKIALPRNDIEALGMRTKEFIDGPAGPLTIGVVDAGEVASKAVGKWSKEPGAYRRVVAALDKAGIGDPAARAEYKAGQGLIGFVDKSGALKGDKFNPEALINGMNKVKVVDELRKRGLGDVFRGPLQAARGVPTAPSSPPVPRSLPKQGVTEGVKKIANPIREHPWAGAALAEMGASALGHHGFGGPAALGYLGSQALPKEIVTQARLTPEQLAYLARVAGLTGTGVRSGINNLLFPPKP